MLGDDIVIWCDILAKKYQEIIHHIGMEIQMQKSHVGENLFEFAKRIFTPYGEITPFSIKAGLSEGKSYLAFIETISHASDRGWIPNISLQDAVLTYYHTIPNRYRSKDRFRLDRKIIYSLHLYNRLKGYDGSLNILRTIMTFSDYPQLTCNMENKAKAMFNSCIVRCFEQAASSYFGDMQRRLETALLYFTGKDGDLWNVVYAHPYAYIYGKYVEESYLSQMKRAYDFDTIYGGE
jgi:hypothetical protein